MLSLEKLKKRYGKQLKEKIKNPIFFYKEILGLELTWFHKEWISLVEENNQVSIMAFRTSGKSEILFVAYPIFKMFTQPKWMGIITSSTLTQAKEILKRIRDRIKENPLLKTSIPDNNRLAAWSKTELELKNGSRIISLPYRASTLRGYHVDWIGNDEAGTYKEHDTFFEAIKFLTKAKRGKTVVAGTPESELDLLHKLIKRQGWVCKKYPAIINGKSAWKERYTLDELYQMQEEDSLAFSQEMMCEPISAQDQKFPYQLLEICFDREKGFTWQRDENAEYYIGVDFSFAAGVKSDDYDFTVMIVLEKKGDHLTIVNMERRKGLSYEGQKSLLKQLFYRYEPIKIVADESRTGIAFVTDLKREGINIYPFKFTHQSKNDLITLLRNTMEKGLLTIPKSKETRTRVMTDILIKELQSFVPTIKQNGTIILEGRGAHDDSVISLALGVFAAMKKKGSFVVKSSSRDFTNHELFYVA